MTLRPKVLIVNSLEEKQRQQRKADVSTKANAIGGSKGKGKNVKQCDVISDVTSSSSSSDESDDDVDTQEGTSAVETAQIHQPPTRNIFLHISIFIVKEYYLAAKIYSNRPLLLVGFNHSAFVP